MQITAAAHIEAILASGDAKIAAIKAAIPTMVKQPGAIFPTMDRLAIAAVQGAEAAVKAEVFSQIQALAAKGVAAARGYLERSAVIPLTYAEAEDLYCWTPIRNPSRGVSKHPHRRPPDRGLFAFWTKKAKRATMQQ